MIEARLVGLTNGTIMKYKDKVHLWIDFCKEFGYDPLVRNENTLYCFFGFLIKERKKTGASIEEYLSALTAYWRFYQLEYKRSGMMSYTIKSLKIKHPVSPRKKKPFSHLFIWWIFHTFYNAKHPNLTILAVVIGILMGYFLGCRPNEYCYSYHKDQYTYRCQIRFIPSKEDAKEIAFMIPRGRSKTNRNGDMEMITIDCHCHKMRFGLPSPCLVHLLLFYEKLRIRSFKKSLKPSDILLVTEVNKPLKYCQVNDFLHKAIIKMAAATKVPLCPHEYTPHALRTGGATDLARMGKNTLFIQQFGRWRSDEWKKVYIALDFTDLAILRNETITFIRNSMRHSVE